jgi:mono/diheme cytochrome c family protein
MFPFKIFYCMWFGLVLWLCSIAPVLSASDSTEALTRFTERIAPVLTQKCVACHRPENRKGGLDLTTRETMLQGGENGVGFVSGKPEESSIYVRSVAMNGERPEMPEKGEPLTPAESQALREWITAGAAWPEKFVLKETAKADASFWSLQPIQNPTPPVVEQSPVSWQSHPLDRFLMQKLHEQKLAPNSPVDARTYIRRATYDLTGLPPTPAEIIAFEKECHEQLQAEQAAGKSSYDLPDAAVEKLIDRLLERPQYGERWGRHWLDVIRFGESRGYERNEIITNLWPFRDYIIESFNQDKPFDRLILEHLAGDVVGKDDPQVEIGSAFLVAGPYDDVGNQDPVAAAQIRADQMDEIIRATSEAFLGLTLGCARCHDHKFDPLLQRDYYALYATFAGTVHGPREVASVNARKERTEKLQPLQAAKQKLLAQRTEIEKQLAAHVKQQEEELAKQWTRPRASRYGTEERFESHEAQYIRFTVEGTDAADPKQTTFKIDEFEVWTDETESRNVALASLGAKATGTAREAKDFAGAYDVSLTIDGKFGERWHAASPDLVITFAKPEKISRIYFSSDRNKALGEDHALTTFVGDYRLETSVDGKAWRQVASSADRQPPSEPRRQARLLQIASKTESRTQIDQLNKEIASFDAQMAKVPALPVWWVGKHQPVAEKQHIFLGGSPQRKGEVVLPSSLQVLQSLSAAYQLEDKVDEGARRIALAKWLTAPEHPLTARVLANRIWQYHFGVGLVDTPSDFGYMGSRPTHPELLDWLATELQRNGWRIKSIHRIIMLSQAYRQSGDWREMPARIDANSRMLWRFPPRRLDAEEIRDTMLCIAGKLDSTMGGPGFRLYEYQQDNVATYVPLDTHKPETYRRAVYHHNARAARVDLLTDYDCPDPAFAEPRRAVTTNPLQALTLMNHSFALDMSRFFAEQLQKNEPTPAGQIRMAFQLAFAREPTEAELKSASELLIQHGLPAVCRALLNANELIQIQ